MKKFKHGYIPLIGVSKSKAGVRIGLYFFMLGFENDSIYLCYKRQLQFVLSWHSKCKPFLKFTTWKNNLKWSVDYKYNPKTRKTRYFWKRENY